MIVKECHICHTKYVSMHPTKECETERRKIKMKFIYLAKLDRIYEVLSETENYLEIENDEINIRLTFSSPVRNLEELVILE